MTDSGIRPTKDSVETMMKMDKIDKALYDYVITEIVAIEGKRNAYEIKVTKTADKGTSAAAYEGKDIGKNHPVFQAVQDLCSSEEYENKGCFILFYMSYVIEGNRDQDKLVYMNWCPETMPTKMKMLTASSWKPCIKKAPSGAQDMIINDINDLTQKGFIEICSKKK